MVDTTYSEIDLTNFTRDSNMSATAKQVDHAYDLSNRLARAIGDNPHPGSLAFYEKLVACAELHSKKQKDYGREQDPFANVRSADEFDIPPWKGAILRGNDKMSRLKTFSRTGTLCNEGVEDSFLDLAVYSLIALVLFEQASKAQALVAVAASPLKLNVSPRKPGNPLEHIEFRNGYTEAGFSTDKTTSPIGE